MSLRNFPPSEMETQLVDDRTPLILSNSVQLQRQKKQLQRRDESSFMPLLCVILAVVFERITYYGTVANLLLFCLNELKTSPSNAIAITFVFAGLAWLMSFIGGLIGDSYSGRYNAIWGSLNIYMYGSFMLLVVAYVVEEKEKVKGIRIVPMALIALLAISVGEGAFKANLTAFGADQLQGQDETRYRRFFNWYYWSINIGSFTAFSAITYFEQVLCFTRAFAILWCCIIASAVFFCSSRSRYICCPPSGNILKKVYNIIKEARRKHKEVSSSNQHCPGLEDYMPVRSWLDHAMMKYGGSYLDSDVEEVKTIGKILIIFAVLVPYWTIYSQMNSTFLLQGLHMRVSLDRNNTLNNFENIPPAWLSLVDVIFVLALIPVMDKCVYPWLDRKGWNWSVFTRISIGFLCAVVSMVAAGMVEVKRAGETHDCVNQTIGSKNYTACLPIVLQIPQYGLIGISEVFASVGALEFAYKEAPKCMQSFVMGLFFVVQSLGSLFGAALFELCSVWRWTPSISGESIEPVSKLKGHLSYYFFLLAGITFLTWLVFLVVSFNSPLNQRNQKRAFMARIRPWQDGQ